MGETNMDIMEKRIRKLEQRNKDQRAAINSAVEHLQPFVESEFVHQSELEELVEEWRNSFHHVRDNCADELEELIE